MCERDIGPTTYRPSAEARAAIAYLRNSGVLQAEAGDGGLSLNGLLNGAMVFLARVIYAEKDGAEMRLHHPDGSVLQIDHVGRPLPFSQQ